MTNPHDAIKQGERVSVQKGSHTMRGGLAKINERWYLSYVPVANVTHAAGEILQLGSRNFIVVSSGRSPRIPRMALLELQELAHG